LELLPVRLDPQSKESQLNSGSKSLSLTENHNIATVLIDIVNNTKKSKHCHTETEHGKQFT